MMNMKSCQCNVLKVIGVWFFAIMPGMIQAQQGVILTREYGNQKQEFWKPVVFQSLENSFAAVRVLFADGKDMTLPKSNVGKIIFVPDLKTLELSKDYDLTATKRNVEELSAEVKGLPQLAPLLTPVIEYLNKAIGDYEQGYVYNSGAKVQRMEVQSQFKPSKGRSIEVAGVKYNDVEITKVSQDSVSMMHSKGISTIPRSVISDALMNSLEEQWPKPFADFLVQARKQAELAMIQKMEREKREIEMQNAKNQQLEIKDALLSRLSKIYDIRDEDLLIQKARLIDGAPSGEVTITPLSDFPRLAERVNAVIDEAEKIAKSSGDSVADLLDSLTIVRPVTRKNSSNHDMVERVPKKVIKPEERANLEKSRVAVAIQVSQFGPEGSLCYGRRVQRIENAGGWVGLQRAPQIVLSPEHDEPICVVGLPKTTVDGEAFMGWLYPCGTYTYTTILGASKTVRKYAISLEEAVKELEQAR